MMDVSQKSESFFFLVLTQWDHYDIDAKSAIGPKRQTITEDIDISENGNISILL